MKVEGRWANRVTLEAFRPILCASFQLRLHGLTGRPVFHDTMLLTRVCATRQNKRGGGRI